MSEATAETKLAVMANDIVYIKEQLHSIDDKVGSYYVTKDEFEPVRRLVYGLVSIILVTVIGGIMAAVMQ